jgi:hypothetical protein
MIKSTTDYDQFIFRTDNREKKNSLTPVDETHVKRLVESITECNLLHMQPIIVNEKLEIIDGQHRLSAAKRLGVEIYYQVVPNLTARDIILMNISKGWTLGDYLNFYVENGYPEYIKMKEFMKRHEVPLTVAMQMLSSSCRIGNTDFRKGEFIFSSTLEDVEIYNCWLTIDFIRKKYGMHF